MGFVLTVVRTVLLENSVTIRAPPANMVKTVRFNVPQTAMEHVDTLMDHVQFVKEAGRVTIAMKHVLSLLEKIVGTHAVRIATISHVTDLTGDAFNVVQTGSMVNCVIKNL